MKVLESMCRMSNHGPYSQYRSIDFPVFFLSKLLNSDFPEKFLIADASRNLSHLRSMKRAISDPFLDEKGQLRSARFTILVTAGLISSAARFFPSLSLLVYKYYESVNGKWLIRPEGKKRDFLRANMARVTMHD